MSVEREMSLAEWCAKLPNQHKVNQELAVLNKQLAALAEQNKQLKAELKSIDFEAFEKLWVRIEKEMRDETTEAQEATECCDLRKRLDQQKALLVQTQERLSGALKAKQFMADLLNIRRKAAMRLRSKIRSILREIPPCRFKDDINAAIEEAD